MGSATHLLKQCNVSYQSSNFRLSTKNSDCICRKNSRNVIDLDQIIQPLTSTQLWEIHKQCFAFDESCDVFHPVVSTNDIIHIIFLSSWDNVIGPKIECVWAQEDDNESRNSSSFCQLIKSMQYAMFHSMSGMLGSSSAKVNSRLFVLESENSVICSVTFCLKKKKTETLHSLSLIIPYEKLNFFMNFYSFCLMWLYRFIQHLQILNQFSDILLTNKLSAIIKQFCLVFEAIKYNGLTPQKISNSTLEKTLLRFPPIFLESAIESHLQTFGCSVVVGSSEADINLIITFLAQFLDEKEQYRCCSVSTERRWPYMAALIIQGLLKDDYGEVHIESNNLLLNSYPTTVIDVDLEKVRRASCFGEKMEFFADHEIRNIYPMKEAPVLAKNLLTDFAPESVLIKTFLKEIQFWGGKKELMIKSFCRQMKFRSFLLLKLYNRCLKDEELLNQIKSSPKMLCNLVTVDTVADVKIIIAFAEKLKPGIVNVLTNSKFSFIKNI